MKKKRRIATLFAVLFIVVLVGCGKKEPSKISLNKEPIVANKNGEVVIKGILENQKDFSPKTTFNGKEVSLGTDSEGNFEIYYKLKNSDETDVNIRIIDKEDSATAIAKIDTTALKDEEIKTEKILKEHEEKKQAKINKKDEKNKRKDQTVKINDGNFNFGNFSIKMEDWYVYQKDNKNYLDFSLNWTNDSFESKKALMAAVSIDVHQSDSLLKETSGTIDQIGGNYYYKAKKGITTPVSFTYELVDDTPVKIVFVSHEEFDTNQEYTIILNK